MTNNKTQLVVQVTIFLVGIVLVAILSWRDFRWEAGSNWLLLSGACFLLGVVLAIVAAWNKDKRGLGWIAVLLLVAGLLNPIQLIQAGGDVGGAVIEQFICLTGSCPTAAYDSKTFGDMPVMRIYVGQPGPLVSNYDGTCLSYYEVRANRSGTLTEVVENFYEDGLNSGNRYNHTAMQLGVQGTYGSSTEFIFTRHEGDDC